MESLQVFGPRGGTVNLVVGVANAPLVLGALRQGGSQVRLANVGTQVVFITLDGTAATLATSMPVQPGVTENFHIPFGGTLNAIAPAAGSTLYATLGEGL